MSKSWKDHIIELAELVNGDAEKLFESAGAVIINDTPEQKTVMVSLKNGTLISLVIIPPNSKLTAMVSDLLDNLKKTTAH